MEKENTNNTLIINSETEKSLPETSDTTETAAQGTIEQNLTGNSNVGDDAKTAKKKKTVGVMIVSVIAVASVIIMVLIVGGNKSSRKDVPELFSQGLLAASTDGKWGYIDKSGSYVINPQFNVAGSFSKNGLAYVNSNGRYGYIDKKALMLLNHNLMGQAVFRTMVWPV